MSGHFDFRNDGNIAARGIGHYFFYLRLSIVTAVCRLFSLSLRFTEIPILTFPVHTPCANVCHFGIFFDFYSPTLVIGEMPMKYIHLMHSKHIEVCVNKFFRKEMPTDIQVHAAPLKPRRINNRYARD